MMSIAERSVRAAQSSTLANYWHPVAIAAHIREQPQRVTLLGHDLVVFRHDLGTSVFDDVCIHRGAALSLGSIIDGRLTCPYHGWQYDRSGACVRIPALAEGSVIPRKARAHVRQSQEAYGLIWVALEDPVAPIPRFPNDEWSNSAYRTIISNHYQWRTSAGRSVENFMDFSHFPFVHEGILGMRDQTVVEPHDICETSDGLFYTFQQTEPGTLHSGDDELVTWEYTLVRPFTIHLRKVAQNGEMTLISMAASPTQEALTHMWLWIARDHKMDPSEDQAFIDFTHTIMEQDRVVVESQRPERIPRPERGAAPKGARCQRHCVPPHAERHRRRRAVHALRCPTSSPSRALAPRTAHVLRSVRSTAFTPPVASPTMLTPHSFSSIRKNVLTVALAPKRAQSRRAGLKPSSPSRGSGTSASTQGIFERVHELGASGLALVVQRPASPTHAVSNTSRQSPKIMAKADTLIPPVSRLENRPLAPQARAEILKAIFDGRFVDKLPNEFRLAEMLNVSRTTVRTALQGLERDGVVTRQRAIGTIINRHVSPSSLALQRLAGFDWLLEERGYDVEVAVNCRWGTAGEILGERFSVPPASDYFGMEKQYRADGRLALVIVDGVPRGELSGEVEPTDIPASLFAFFATHCRTTIHHAVVEIIPCGSATDATNLDLPPNTSFLRLQETHYSAGGDAVAYSVIDVDDRFIRLEVVRSQ